MDQINYNDISSVMWFLSGGYHSQMRTQCYVDEFETVLRNALKLSNIKSNQQYYDECSLAIKWWNTTKTNCGSDMCCKENECEYCYEITTLTLLYEELMMLFAYGKLTPSDTSFYNTYNDDFVGLEISFQSDK
jgi:hypothetical protein